MLCAASVTFARAVLRSLCASAARARSSNASPCCSASRPGSASALSRSSAALPGWLASIHRLPAAAYMRAVFGSLSLEAFAASSKPCAAAPLSPAFCDASARHTKASGVTMSGQADGAQDRVDLERLRQAMAAALEHIQLDIA